MNGATIKGSARPPPPPREQWIDQIVNLAMFTMDRTVTQSPHSVDYTSDVDVRRCPPGVDVAFNVPVTCLSAIAVESVNYSVSYSTAAARHYTARR